MIARVVVIAAASVGVKAPPTMPKMMVAGMSSATQVRLSRWATLGIVKGSCVG